MSLDPHSRAGSVLRQEASRTIEARLAAAVGQRPARAERDPRCLGCHVRPGEGVNQTLASIVQEEGVGCEACHGASGRWLELHSATPWKRLSDRERTALGMSATRDLAQRAAICARCHVGGEGDDVDHDLIAAGHPRLSFEFLSYLEAMPAHWDTSAERHKPRGFEARAWSIGQIVSARQALELLSDRARGNRRSSAGGKNRPLHAGVWPEFAEYACASCHQEIGELLPASASKSRPSLPGTPQWGIWYFSMLGPLSVGGTEIEGDPLAKLRRLMNDPTPTPEEVEKEALIARAWCDRESLRDSTMTQTSVERVKGLMIRCLDASSLAARPTWDQKAQLVLALDPLSRALRDLKHSPSPEMNAALEEMRRLLETTQVAAPAALPRSLDDERFRDALQRYRRALSRPRSGPP